MPGVCVVNSRHGALFLRIGNEGKYWIVLSRERERERERESKNRAKWG
jgi:hypothetical protein